MKTKPKTWGVTEFDELLAGVAEPEMLRTVDRRGMTPVIAAALESGSATNRLMALLDNPNMVEGESAIDRIEELLGEMVAQQKTTNEKLDAIIRILSPRSAKAAEKTQKPKVATPPA